MKKGLKNHGKKEKIFLPEIMYHYYYILIKIINAIILQLNGVTLTDNGKEGVYFNKEKLCRRRISYYGQ